MRSFVKTYPFLTLCCMRQLLHFSLMIDLWGTCWWSRQSSTNYAENFSQLSHRPSSSLLTPWCCLTGKNSCRDALQFTPLSLLKEMLLPTPWREHLPLSNGQKLPMGCERHFCNHIPCCLLQKHILSVIKTPKHPEIKELFHKHSFRVGVHSWKRVTAVATVCWSCSVVPPGAELPPSRSCPSAFFPLVCAFWCSS